MTKYYFIFIATYRPWNNAQLQLWTEIKKVILQFRVNKYLSYISTQC